MSTIRFFSGGRDPSGKKSIASEILKLEHQKKGKLDPTERFKLIMKRKMEEHRRLTAKEAGARPMSKKAENALKEVAAKKAAKEAKKMRKMVIVQPQIFNNGRLTKNGKVYDIAGNMVATVNKKNGRMATMLGTNLGQYKPKSQFVNGVLVSAINQWSPYYINLRKMQAMQAAGIDPVTGQPLNNNTINVHGNSAAMHGAGYVPPSQSGHQSNYFNTSPDAQAFDSYGTAGGGPRQNIGVTAWGATSDNVWGTFADNAWGVSSDNVWGGNSSDIWGGIGPSVMAGKTVQIWGTGSGKNYIKAITNAIAKLFGRPNKQTVNAFKAAQAGRTSTRGPRTSSRSGGGSTRSSAPTTTRR